MHCKEMLYCYANQLFIDDMLSLKPNISGHRLITTFAPGIATQYTPDTQLHAAKKTMFGQCFACVLWTGRRKTAWGRHHRTNAVLVNFYKTDDESWHFCNWYINNLISVTNCFENSGLTGRLKRITQSIAMVSFSLWDVLKASRNNRLIQLRWTAPRSIFLETINPKREYGKPFGLAYIWT